MKAKKSLPKMATQSLAFSQNSLPKEAKVKEKV
jgi:hypothetical protein